MQPPTVDWVFPQQWLIQTTPHTELPMCQSNLGSSVQATPDSSVKMKLRLRACVTWEGFNRDPEESSRGCLLFNYWKTEFICLNQLKSTKKKKEKRKNKLTFTRHNRITCPEMLHSAAKNLHIDTLKNSSRWAPNMCGRQMRVDSADTYRGLGRSITAVLSQGKEEENCINYPHTKDTVPTYKKLNSEFSRLKYTALLLNHLGRAIWTCILPGQISSQWRHIGRQRETQFHNPFYRHPFIDTRTL